MKKSIKNTWLKALRSGKYKQGKGCLVSYGKYCCLGILRTVIHKGSRLSQDNKGNILNGYQLIEFGLTTIEQHRLANMNDGGNSFETIADYISENL